jgi:NhaP-type Na+/H+ or K+/H+ antiporter
MSGESQLSAAFMLGSILSATDPVAVVAILKELGASQKLGTIIEGESLMNDGTAMVAFEVPYSLLLSLSLFPPSLPFCLPVLN